MEGEPIKAFTLTVGEVEILDRSRRLAPEKRDQLINILRQLTGPQSTPTADGRQERRGRDDRGATP
jgi:transcription antitermination factor NusA-like protein